MFIYVYFLELVSIIGASLAVNNTERDLVLKELLRNYNSAVPPNYNHDDQLRVEIQVYILSIDSISDSSKDFALSFFLRHRWNDSRLIHDPKLGTFQLSQKSMNKVWVPELFILNEKRTALHRVSTPDKLLHIKPDGLMYYSTRISGTFSCDVNLLRYPLDHQMCPLTIESYGYTSETLDLQWYKEPVEEKDDIILSQFSLGCEKTIKCDKVYAGLKFSCVQMNIKLDRLYDYYLIQTYIPTTLIVILSWVSFWISIDATPARISLGLLTVLTMTTQNTGLPKVSYFKAIDVWMVSCMFFVFAALIEFAYVNVLSRVQLRRQTSVVDNGDHDNTPSTRKSFPSKNDYRTGCRFNICFQNMANREKARNVDRISRFMFPLLFVLFNLFYWIIYLFVLKTKADIQPC
ncbi:glycine receptor subunit alpha-2-like [Mytilus californianus]|uniref:glycine receptor subunit alpha-2-like n=1 Tax=Mytilus californianus TaxID=6549 RepID=UPI002247E30F|nr:glycine receptor subunit alpha-2-like [Mytilus californianus]